jgi:hypothetical protein
MAPGPSSPASPKGSLRPSPAARAGRSFAAGSIPSGDSGPEQLVELIDDFRTRLAALKPAERRALSLIAAGFSYSEVTGFSYTKTNRCATEGRAALRSS